MGEIEKLRALLAEAREFVALFHEAGCPDDQCEGCAAANDMTSRIDAALAEPVEGPLNVISRLQQQLHEAKSNADWLVQQALRERDEARAEVERLQGAYQRGAEAMREAAAQGLDRLLTKKKATAIWVSPDEIRALPVPEDK